MAWLSWAIAAALAARLVVQLILAALNAREVRRNAHAVPEAYRDMIDDATYRRGVEYTLVKNRFGRLEDVFDAIVLAVVLLSGVLPAAWAWWIGRFGESAAAGSLFLIAFTLVLSLPGLPFEWWSQFRIEQRFGFNRSTLRLWIIDHLKGLVLALALGFPILWLLLKIVEWVGPSWWLVGWAVFITFQLVLLVVYPMLILPWFNKLTPLPPGPLCDRLLELAGRARFHASRVQVMDGSKRSAHSNAFFTGFGRFRRIVLFDTLIGQLAGDELEAVLAHEIGHYKLGHVPRMIVIAALLSLAGFWLIGWLAGSASLFGALGFAAPSVAVAFLLFVLLRGVVGFWFAPAMNLLSRRHEYQADAFARGLTGGPDALVGALRKLSEKNLSNLTPHPLFSAFFYSHPTLGEREAALRTAG